MVAVSSVLLDKNRAKQRARLLFAVCVAWERRQHKWASPSDQKELKRIFFLFFTATVWGVARLPAMTRNSFGIEIFILFLLLVTLYVYTGFPSCHGCDQHSLLCLYRFPKLPSCRGYIASTEGKLHSNMHSFITTLPSCVQRYLHDMLSFITKFITAMVWTVEISV